MKVGIIGAGAVGASCAREMLSEDLPREIVLIDINERRARGAAADLSDWAIERTSNTVKAGEYKDIRDAAVVVVTAGVNERAGGAIDRSDPKGRLRLLPDNSLIYADVVPQIAANAPKAPILVVTDPPDALADVARCFTKTNLILSSGTFLDSTRFRRQIAAHLEIDDAGLVVADVLGEHGTSAVYHWSAAKIGADPVLDRVARDGGDPATFRTAVEQAVRFANIDIIDGTGASQHGIGSRTARIVKALLGEEDLEEPVAVFQSRYRVTLSIRTLLQKNGSTQVRPLALSTLESEALEKSAAFLRTALIELGRSASAFAADLTDLRSLEAP